MIDKRYGFISEFAEIDRELKRMESKRTESSDGETGDDGIGGGLDSQNDASLRIREIWNWIREETSS